MQKQSYSVTFSPLPIISGEALYYDKHPVPIPYAEDFRTLHYHDRYEIGVCESGEGLFLLENEVFYFGAGDAIFVPPESHHYSRSLHTDAPCLCRFVYVDAEAVERLMHLLYKEDVRAEAILKSAKGVVTPVFSPTKHPEKTAKLTELVRCSHEGNPDLDKTTLLHLALFLLDVCHTSTGTAPTATQSNDTVISTAIEYIATHYEERDTLPALVKLCRLSESQLRRRFLLATGLPPIAYRNLFRCKIASTLLTQTQMSIAEIATRVGFGDVSDFYRAFRHYYKSPPSKWRSASLSGTLENVQPELYFPRKT